MTVTDLPSVGFLGLGIMGVAMARNLVESGQFNVYVWNRTASKVRAAPSCHPMHFELGAICRDVMGFIVYYSVRSW